MPRWLPRALIRVHAGGKVRLTSKADRELVALGLGLDPDDVREVLVSLTSADCAAGELVYVKLILRSGCVVVSFHQDEEGGHEKDE